MAFYTYRLPDGSTIQVPLSKRPDEVEELARKQFPEAYATAASEKRASSNPLRDIPGSVVSGIGSLVQFPGQVGTLFGASPDNAVVRAGQAVRDFGQDIKSEGLRERERKLALIQQEVEGKGLGQEALAALKAYADDPYMTFNKLVELLPQLVATVGAGAAARLGTKVLLPNVAEKGLERAAVAGAAGAGASMQAASVGDETYRRVYEAATKQGMPHEEADKVAREEARIAAAKAGAVSATTMALLPGAEKAILTRGRPGMARGAARTGTGEAVQEGIEEGAGTYFAGVGEQSVDPTVDPTAGVGFSAASGAVLGGLTGAGTGAYGGAREADAARQLERAKAAQERQLAAEEERKNKEAEEAKKQTPEYVVQLDSRYKAYQAEMKALQEQITAFGKVEKGSSEDLQRKALIEQQKQLREDNKDLVAEHAQRAKDIKRAEAEARVAGMDPYEYWLERNYGPQTERPEVPELGPDEYAATVKPPTAAEPSSYAAQRMQRMMEQGGASLEEYADALMADYAEAEKIVKSRASIPFLDKDESQTVKAYMKEMLAEGRQELASRQQDLQTAATKPTEDTFAYLREAMEEDPYYDPDTFDLGEARGQMARAFAFGEQPEGRETEEEVLAREARDNKLRPLREEYVAALQDYSQKRGTQEAVQARRRIIEAKQALTQGERELIPLTQTRIEAETTEDKDFSGIEDLINRALGNVAGTELESDQTLEQRVQKLSEIRDDFVGKFTQLMSDSATGTPVTKRELDTAKREIAVAALAEIKAQRELNGLVPLQIPDSQFVAQFVRRLEKDFTDKSARKRSDQKTAKQSSIQPQIDALEARAMQLTRMLTRTKEGNAVPTTLLENRALRQEEKDRLYGMLELPKDVVDKMLAERNALLRRAQRMKLRSDPYFRYDQEFNSVLDRQINNIQARLREITGTDVELDERRGMGAMSAYKAKNPSDDGEVRRLVRALFNLRARRARGYGGAEIDRIAQNIVDGFTLRGQKLANVQKKAIDTRKGQPRRITGQEGFTLGKQLTPPEKKFEATPEDAALVRRMREEEIADIDEAVTSGRYVGEQAERADRALQQLISKVDDPVTQEDVTRAREKFPQAQPDQPDLFREGLDQYLQEQVKEKSKYTEPTEAAKKKFGTALAGMRGKSQLKDAADRLAAKFGKRPAKIDAGSQYEKAKKKLEEARASLKALERKLDVASWDVWRAMESKLLAEDFEQKAHARAMRRTLGAALARLRNKEQTAQTAKLNEDIVELMRTIDRKLIPRIATNKYTELVRAYEVRVAQLKEKLANIDRATERMNSRLNDLEQAMSDRPMSATDNAALEQTYKEIQRIEDELQKEIVSNQLVDATRTKEDAQEKAAKIAEANKPILEQIAETQRRIDEILARGNSVVGPRFVAVEEEARYKKSTEEFEAKQRRLEQQFGTPETRSGIAPVTKVTGTYGKAFDEQNKRREQTADARAAKSADDFALRVEAGLKEPIIDFDGEKEMRIGIPAEASSGLRFKLGQWLRSKGFDEQADRVEDDATEIVIQNWLKGKGRLPKRQQAGLERPVSDVNIGVSRAKKGEGPTVAQAIKAARAQFKSAVEQGQKETAIRPQRNKGNATFNTGVPEKKKRTRRTNEEILNERLGLGEMSVGDIDSDIFETPKKSVVARVTAENNGQAYTAWYLGDPWWRVDSPAKSSALFNVQRRVNDDKSQKTLLEKVELAIEDELEFVTQALDTIGTDKRYPEQTAELKESRDFLLTLRAQDIVPVNAPPAPPIQVRRTDADRRTEAINNVLRRYGVSSWATENPLHGMSFAEAAKYGEQKAKSPVKKALFKAIAATLEKSDGRVAVGDGLMKHKSGATTRPVSHYYAYGNYVFLNVRDAESGLDTLLHELAHAATARGLDNNAALREEVSKLREKAIAFANSKEGRAYVRSKLFLRIPDLDNPGKRQIYGLKNNDEFLAEAFSNKRFQDFLMQIPSENPKINLWTRFVQSVAKFFGFDKPAEMGLLADVFAVAEKVMDATAIKQGLSEDFEVGNVLNAPVVRYEDNDIKAASDIMIGKDKPLLDRLRANATGLAFRVRMIENDAALKEALKKGDPNLAIQYSYDSMMFNQRNHILHETVMNGAPTREWWNPDKKDFQKTEVKGGASLKRVSELLAEVKGYGNHQATTEAFTLLSLAKRAETRGWTKVFGDLPPLDAPKGANEATKKYFADENKKRVEENKRRADARAKADDLAKQLNAGNSPFAAAYKEYQDYNKEMLRFAMQAGVISEESFRELSRESNYTPLFRKDKVGNLVLELDSGREITVGRIQDEARLEELMGGTGQVMDFFTASVRNASVLIDASLQNITARNAAFALRAMGAARQVGKGAANPNIIEFRVKGEKDLQRFEVDTEAFGIPTELVVKGMAGVPASLPGWVRLMGMPAQLLRKAVTRNPLYMFRTLIRDPLNAWLVTGAKMEPVTDTVKELGKALSGKADKTLDRRGITGGMIFSEDFADLERIRDAAAKASPWSAGYWAAKLDEMSMAADAVTRRNVYNGAIKEGASEIQATLAAYESMPFSKRGTSPSMRFLNHMVPFLSATVQGWDVLYRAAVKNDMPLSERVNVRNKLLMRGGVLAGLSMLYAMTMADEEEYPRYANANTSERLNNWFLPIPGTEEMLKLPVPFELGIIFKMLPEALVRGMQDDKQMSKELRSVAEATLNMVPNIVIPQAVLPTVEALANYSFFTGNPIENQGLGSIDIGQRTGKNTAELSKLLGFDVEIAGKQFGISPVMMEYMLSQYTAGLYPALAALVDTVLPAPTAAKPDRALAEMPLFRSALVQEDAGGKVNRLYEEMERFSRTNATFKKLLETDPKKAQAYMQEKGEEVVKGEMANKFRAAINKFNEVENIIRRDPNMPSDQKKKAIDNIKRLRSQLADQFSGALAA